MKHTIYRRLLCAVCSVALLFCAVCPSAAAAEDAAAAQTQQTLTAAQVLEMQQADAAVTALTDSDAYVQMTETERQAAALAQLDTLVQQGLVEKGSIYLDAENGMVSFAYTCGALGGILLTDPESEADAALTGQDLAEAAALQAAENGTVGSAVICYAFDNGVNSSRYPYYSYMKSYWTAAGLDTHLDMMVTVSDLKRLADYDLAILSAHGAYYTYQYGWLWKRQATAPIILLLEQADLWNDLRYGMDLLSHRVIKVNGCYAVTGDFFRNAYRDGRLQGTIVLSETCEFYGRTGHMDEALADGLLAGGAAAVAGYVNNVYSVYSRSMLWATVNRLLEGKTLQQAIAYSQQVYGADDVVWYYAQQTGRRPHPAASYPIIRGSGDARLAAAAAGSNSLAAVQELPEAA